jgi:hypothetical protein
MVYNIRRTNFNSLKNFITWHIEKQKKDFNLYSETEIEKINSLIKIEFYNKKQYKWQVKKVYTFIPFIDMSAKEFILFLNSFFKYYYLVLKDLKGKKGVSEFLKTLNNRDLNEIEHKRSIGFGFKEGEVPIEFVQEMKVLKEKYLCVSHNNFVNFIYKNFNTNYTKKTLRRYYFDGQK